MITTMKLQKYVPVLVIGIAVLSLGYVFLADRARAADATTLPATVATSSARILTTTNSLVFATSTCAARVISTTGSAVMLSFGNTAQPTAGSGIQQTASTTVVYDAGQYGCGAVYAYSFSSATSSWLESR